MFDRFTRRSLPSPMLAGALLAATVLAACGGSGSHDLSMENLGPDPDRFLEPAPQETLAVMSGPPATPGGPAVNWNYLWTGTQKIGGKTFGVYLGTEQTATPNTIEIVMDYTGDSVTIASFTVDDYGLGDPGVPDFVIDGPVPVKIDLDVPVGKPQTVTASGALTVAGGEPTTGTVTATFTLVDDDATVQTAQGPIAGTKHYTATSDTNPPVTGEVWIQTGVGIVAAKYDFFLISPNGPKTWNLADFQAGGDAGDGRRKVRRDIAIGAGTGEYRLASRDAAGEIDADKDVHAKMLLEARWADEARAKTDEAPPVHTMFEGGWGYFPEGSIAWQPLPFSILNPHENGAGYKFWYKFVDQALKNERFQPNVYSIHADWKGEDGDTGQVRLSGLINYRKYTP